MREYDEKSLMSFVKNNNLKTAEDVTSKFREMYKDVIEVMLENEMNDHLGYEKYNRNSKEISNSRNGSSSKKVKSSFGELLLKTPRDRNSSFEPIVIEKHETSLSGDIEKKIISMYSKGMSTRDISDHIKDIYGMGISSGAVSQITNSVLESAKEWQARPLDSVYPFVFLDAIHYSVKTENKIVKRAAYVVLGINLEGNKEVLGIYIGENESSKFWLMVLTDLKNRGVKDIFIASVDGLNGFSNAIHSVFEKTEIQRCIVHQIRNTLKYVPWKDRKPFAKDLKNVYSASNQEDGYQKLIEIEEKWGKKYFYAIKSWKENWAELSTFFAYTPEVRKIMYTTNIIENLHRQYRKVSKTKTVFPTDESLLKILYLSTVDITKKWTQSIRGWTQILGQLSIHFEGRF
jgi:putative transposase